MSSTSPAPSAPTALDDTFGSWLTFFAGLKVDVGQNRSPTASFQVFGHVRVDRRTGPITATLKDGADADLFRVTLEPGRGEAGAGAER